MTNVLILGAGGQIARHVVRFLEDSPSIRPTLFVRDAAKLADVSGMSVVAGDAGDVTQLRRAMTGQDIVYANLAGDVDRFAAAILEAMQGAGIRRLVFITTLGIYDEVPGRFGAWNRREIGAYLPPYRRAADRVEASGIDHTVVRPAWLTDNDEVAYETTEKGEAFRGTEVSRKSVAAFVMRILEDPAFAAGRNVGINKPGTDGDKPAFL